MREDEIDKLLATALEHHRAQRFSRAQELYQEILDAQPRHPDALFLLGSLLRHTGEPRRAVELIRRAIEINPGVADYHNNLGTALLDLGELAQARDAFVNALQLNPNLAEARINLGRALIDQGDAAGAINQLQAAIALSPKAIVAHNELARALRLLDRLDEAADVLRAAIQLRPDLPQAHNNLGNILKDKAELDQAIECYRRAMSVSESYPAGHSNLICTMHFHPAIDSAALYAEQRRWNDRYTKDLARSTAPHSNDRDPDRRLRVGFVSPDFRDHCQAIFTFPLLRNLNRQTLEVFGYSNVAFPDGTTQQLKSMADQWRDIARLNDEQGAELIRQDQIDVLVDLTMHMHGNRLRVFARKPAPVQCCWLAYPGSTGLDAIDFRITDPYLDPPNGGSDQFYSEQSLRLPETFWCYDPLSDEPSSADPPVLKRRHITFGCLNNFCKVTRDVLRLWSRVLLAVPDSRMIILSGIGRHRQRTLDILRGEGVNPERITFIRRLPRKDYLKQYHGIDIGLDTFPYNGHTTSLDAMWMGVPTVTLVGRTVVGRAGLSQLSNVGLADLAARSEDEFVKIATRLATDLHRLTALRSSLRQRMQTSPLMDAPRFARNFEAALRTMWQHRCSGDTL